MLLCHRGLRKFKRSGVHETGATSVFRKVPNEPKVEDVHQIKVENACKITLVTIERPLEDVGDEGVGVRCRASFTLPRVDAGKVPTLEEPTLTGTKPFPLRS